MVSKTEWVMIIGSAGIIVVAILYPYLKRKIDSYSNVYLPYTYQGIFHKDAYNSYRGGDRGELNEECLLPIAGSPGYRFCMLTDGSPGVCGTSGRCLPDMLHDGRLYRDDIKLPMCTKPVFKEGCARFCECKNMVDPIDKDRCVERCQENFHPS